MTQTIGQRLKAEREGQKLTLEKVFEATRIRVPYLQALETDDLSSVPSPVQARGYLRNYAEYLGLDFQKLLDELRENMEGGSTEVIGPADEASAPGKAVPAQDTMTPVPPPMTEIVETLLKEVAQEQNALVEETTPLATPQTKPRRRKKTDSGSESASVDPTPKRRGRKKIQPEPIPTLEPEPIEAAEDKPEIIEQPPAEVESVTQPEPVSKQSIEPSQEAVTQTDVSNTLWQKWLNRLSSVLSARGKRLTLVPREVLSPENGLEAVFKEPEIPPPSDVFRPPAAREDLSARQSTEIFKEIGVQLRERRELLSLHLDEVERNTHVKAHYLAALEKGAMDELPSTVQTRGMLSNYATFLDMDVDALLLRFADALQARHRERNPQKPGRKPGQPIIANIPPIRTFIAGDIIFGIGIAVLLVGFAIWGVSRVVAIQSQQEVQPTAPSISDVLLASPDPAQIQATATLQPVESFPGLATVTVVIPTQDLNVNVQVNLVALERTFMRVIVDGEIAFEGRVVPG
ncbi:MAG TPA: helix-turn-helix domain-containing protein, partial [Candidatus Binatia bacterium]|nr:helix-turn-helix domain-containing protein [Candidatus Binatia bacterium]